MMWGLESCLSFLVTERLSVSFIELSSNRLGESSNPFFISMAFAGDLLYSDVNLGRLD